MLLSYRRVMKLERNLFSSQLVNKTWAGVTLTVILLEASLLVPLGFRTGFELCRGWDLMESGSISTLHSMQ